jgi:hypothetical protein
MCWIPEESEAFRAVKAWRLDSIKCLDVELSHNSSSNQISDVVDPNVHGSLSSEAAVGKSI